MAFVFNPFILLEFFCIPFSAWINRSLPLFGHTIQISRICRSWFLSAKYIHWKVDEKSPSNRLYLNGTCVDWRTRLCQKYELLINPSETCLPRNERGVFPNAQKQYMYKISHEQNGRDGGGSRTCISCNNTELSLCKSYTLFSKWHCV